MEYKQADLLNLQASDAQFSASDDSEDDDDDDVSQQKPWLALLGVLLYELLLVMILLYELRAYLGFEDGDANMAKWVVTTGLTGVALALLPIFLEINQLGGAFTRMFFDVPFCAGETEAYKKKHRFACIGLVHLFFTIAFLWFCQWTGDNSATLVRIEQKLSIETACRDGHLLVVEELLSFDPSQTGTAMRAIRSLPNQVEPKILGMDNVDSVPGLKIESVDRKTRHAWDLDYESGQLTDVKFTFDLQNEAFQVKLRYTAAIRGSGIPCAKGGSVCPSEKQGWDKVTGWWDMCAPEGTEVKFDMASPQGEWGVQAAPTNSQGTQYNLELLAPHDLGVGGKQCPLAWELEGRNYFWIAGSSLLGAAIASCVCVLQFAGRGGVVLGTGIAGVLTLLSLVCFGLALFWDTMTREF